MRSHLSNELLIGHRSELFQARASQVSKMDIACGRLRYSLCQSSLQPPSRLVCSDDLGRGPLLPHRLPVRCVGAGPAPSERAFSP